jgi:RNA polymerase sigma factor (sigma-70 family)
MNITRSNHEWVSLVGDDDSDAISDLYHILHRHVCHFVRDTSRINSFDLDNFAQDIAQDAIISIRKRINRYEYRSRFTSWACAIARNRAIDLVRERRKETFVLSLDAMTIQQVESLCSISYDYDMLVELDYIIRNHLNERQRYALLETIDGTSAKEIAIALNTNANNVSKIVFDAKALIRDLIGQ